MTKEFIVFNDTDGFPASPDTFKTTEEAQEFIKNFPLRFKHQGFYFTSNMQKIRPEEVKLRIEEI